MFPVLRFTVPAALSLASLVGCKSLEPVTVDIDGRTVSPPASWTTQVDGDPIASAWLARFESPQLSELVDEALRSNEDLRLAAANFRVARAQFALEAANEGAEVGFTGSASRRGVPLASGARNSTSSFETRLDAAWEADVWNRLSDLTLSAALNADASAADYAAARLSLAANVAQAWFNAVAAHLQEGLAQETVANFEDNLAIVEEGFRAGLATALDVRLERANLAGAQAKLQSRRVDLERARRSLEVLLGRYPAGTIALPDKLPPLQAAVPAGLPADLLTRRPDIRAAYMRIESSTKRQQAAGKARLPSLRLTSSGGLSSSELRNLLNFDSLLWSLALAIAAPIIDAGRIDAQVDLQAARADQQLAGYAKIVLQAFAEVENTLAAEGLLAERERALAVSAEESGLAAELALERYSKGLVDIVTWLEARRRSFDAHSALITVSNQRLQNRIALFLALGGDFGAADYTTAITEGSLSPLALHPEPIGETRVGTKK